MDELWIYFHAFSLSELQSKSLESTLTSESLNLSQLLCIENCFKPVLTFSLDGAGKLPTGYAVIEGHPDLK